MFPFMRDKNRSAAGVIMKARNPDEKPTPSEVEDDPKAAIKACAKDLISAIHSQSVDRVAEALQSAFEILDSQPHEEGPHIEPHSYDAQNRKAGQE